MAEDLAFKVSDGKVKVLRVGDENPIGKTVFYAPATITLLKRRNAHELPIPYALVDCGCFGEELEVQRLLAQEGIKLEEVGEIFVTHNHPDHIGTIGQFKRATAYLPDSQFSPWRPNRFVLGNPTIYRTPGRIHTNAWQCLDAVTTPGHSGWDLSYVYYGTDGRTAMVGDLFWSQKDWEQDNEYLELCVDPEMQKRSRDYIRERFQPEVVVPGHGPAFAPKY